ncbi:hypothetical protein ACFYKX_26390 [Cytobacillus sp. FJAT-54145]|uniref:Uncharacterized protein n=1 Tax=Cytobacillus spartinae TaxID=3299023 RepID=A0ABW6KIU1_9BACI
MRDKIWSYVNNRFEDDWVLVDADEVYEAFAVYFDNGLDVGIIDEVIRSFAAIHDLSNVDIQYEGNLS